MATTLKRSMTMLRRLGLVVIWTVDRLLRRFWRFEEIGSDNFFRFEVNTAPERLGAIEAGTPIIWLHISNEKVPDRKRRHRQGRHWIDYLKGSMPGLISKLIELRCPAVYLETVVPAGRYHTWRGWLEELGFTVLTGKTGMVKRLAYISEQCLRWAIDSEYAIRPLAPCRAVRAWASVDRLRQKYKI